MYWNIYEEHEWNEVDKPCPKIALWWTVSIGIPCDWSSQTPLALSETKENFIEIVPKRLFSLCFVTFIS